MDLKRVVAFKNNNTAIHGLEFAKARIKEYFEYRMNIPNKSDNDLKNQKDHEIKRIEDEINLLKKDRDWNQDKNVEKLLSSIKSGCEIYLKDLEVLEKRTEIAEFRHEIENVKKILDSEDVMSTNGGNYDTYYSGEYCSNCGALRIAGVKTCTSCKPKPGKF